jgi:hypothetical protein
VLSVVTFLWPPENGGPVTYTADHVNTLHSMVKRNLKVPFEFVCISDDWKGLHPDIRFAKLWINFGKLKNPSGAKLPNCYRRLKLFDRDTCKFERVERLLWLDLDMVITADITPLVDNDIDFKILGGSVPGQPYNGSMLLMNAGARQQVWDTFDSDVSPQKSVADGYFGSDQAWIASCLGPNERTWSSVDGVYSFLNDVRPKGTGSIPSDARIVNFAGMQKPWHHVHRCEWVRSNYK